MSVKSLISASYEVQHVTVEKIEMMAINKTNYKISDNLTTTVFSDSLLPEVNTTLPNTNSSFYQLVEQLLSEKSVVPVLSIDYKLESNYIKKNVTTNSLLNVEYKLEDYYTKESITVNSIISNKYLVIKNGFTEISEVNNSSATYVWYTTKSL